MGNGGDKPRNPKRDGKTDRTPGKSSGKSPRGSRYKKSVGGSTIRGSHINQKIKKQPKKARVSPTCTIVFSALGFQSLEQMPNLENYEQSPIADKSDIVYDRGLNYACQVNTVVKSLLLKSNDILDYELDEEGGVAQSSSIPTFNYFISELSHDIYYKNRHPEDIRNIDYRHYSFSNGSRNKFNDDDP